MNKKIKNPISHHIQQKKRNKKIPNYKKTKGENKNKKKKQRHTNKKK